MPRKPDPCLFCGDLPCTCEEDRPKKAAPKKKEKPAEAATPISSIKGVDLKAAMRAAVQQQQPPSPVPAVTVTAQAIAASVRRSDTEDDFTRCINILAPLLHEEELSKYDDLITLQTRVALWKERVRDRAT